MRNRGPRGSDRSACVRSVQVSLVRPEGDRVMPTAQEHLGVNEQEPDPGVDRHIRGKSGTLRGKSGILQALLDLLIGCC